MNTELLPNMPCLVKGRQFLRGENVGELHQAMTFILAWYNFLIHGCITVLHVFLTKPLEIAFQTPDIAEFR